MVNALFPSTTTALVDSKQLTTTPWRNFFASLNALLAEGVITEAQFEAALLEIVTALGSTDGTADTIIDFANLGITGAPPILVTGNPRDGFHISIAPTFAATIQGRPGQDGQDGEDAWPIPGPCGPMGIQGLRGPPGWDGMDGDDGWRGPPGTDGAAGSAGTAGAAGAMGPPGMDADTADSEPWPVNQASLLQLANIWVRTQQLMSGSASAPSLKIETGATNSGFYSAGANDISVSLASVRNFAFNGGNFYILTNAGGLIFGSSIDTGINRNAAGVVEVNSGTPAAYRDLKLRNLLAAGGNGSYIQTPAMTVANLPAAPAAGAGALAFVTDGATTVVLGLGLAVAGGGANKVPVYSDGTSWIVG